MGKKPHPGGRPRIEFDWNLVDSLLMLNASESFVAERLIIQDGDEINKLTIDAKIKLLQRRISERFGMSFVQYRDKKLDGKRYRLSELQWQTAEAGNVTMQIWLGKQLLGQTDKQEVKSDQVQTVKIESFTAADIKELIKKDPFVGVE